MFELVQSMVASKPAKLEALFVQFSDHKQAATARHQATKAKTLHSQPQPQQQQQRQQHHQRQQQGAKPGPPSQAILAVPARALPAMIADLVGPASVSALSPSSEEHPAGCALRASDMLLLLSVLQLDNGVGAAALPADIRKATLISRLESAGWAARRAAALHRSEEAEWSSD